jgi:Peptidase M15
MERTLADVKQALAKARHDRDVARERYDAQQDKLENLHALIEAERHQIQVMKEHRQELHDELQHERKLDDKDKPKGAEGEHWEQRKVDKLGTLADECEASEARLDRLFERIDEHEDLRQEFREEMREENPRIDRLRKKRKAMAEDKEGQLTEHFHVAEFDCHDGTPVPKASYDALEAWCRDIGEPLRAKFGAVHINSGYRTPAYNATLEGAATMSIHLYADHPNASGDAQAVAADVVCDSGSPSEWYAFTSGIADGRGSYATFHHCDNRNRIGWSDSTWSG